jgi:hypothetical protein
MLLLVVANVAAAKCVADEHLCAAGMLRLQRLACTVPTSAVSAA